MMTSPGYAFNRTRDLAEANLDVPPAIMIARALRPYIPAFTSGILTADDLIKAVPRRNGLETLPSARAFPSPGVNAENDFFIDVNGLEYTYMSGTPFAHPALNGASLHVRQGSVHALLGATGSGKSTLLQHLNGLLRPQAGSVSVGGFQLDQPGVDLKALHRLAGMVFQDPDDQLFEQYVGDEIAYGLRLGGMQSQSDLRQRVRWAMEMVGLDFDGFKDRITFSLSGGERRRVALASILAMQPQVLLLDEPLAGLDPASHGDMLEKFRHFNRSGMTLLLSTHYMEDAAELASEITVMGDGRERLTGSPGDVFSRVDDILSLGLEPPIVARTAEAFRRNGWELPPGILHLQTLVESIKELAGP